jgi:4-aminobutyrate aminotransferase-like enzyme
MLGESLPRIVAPPPGPRARAMVETLAETECPALTARRARRREKSGAAQDPIVWARARGANVEDVDGNVYVDLTAGFGVAAMGHAHPRVVDAVRAQS